MERNKRGEWILTSYEARRSNPNRLYNGPDDFEFYARLAKDQEKLTDINSRIMDIDNTQESEELRLRRYFSDLYRRMYNSASSQGQKELIVENAKSFAALLNADHKIYDVFQRQLLHILYPVVEHLVGKVDGSEELAKAEWSALTHYCIYYRKAENNITKTPTLDDLDDLHADICEP